MKMRVWIGFIILFAGIVGFSRRSHPLMTEEDFVNLYVQLARAVEENLADSLALHNRQQEIFEKSGFTREQFDDYTKELDKNPERWQRVWSKIEAQLKEKEKSAKQGKGTKGEKPDK